MFSGIPITEFCDTTIQKFGKTMYNDKLFLKHSRYLFSFINRKVAQKQRLGFIYILMKAFKIFYVLFVVNFFFFIVLNKESKFRSLH